jgi:phage terminase Nu1 subunit (DNA packaging protein)
MASIIGVSPPTLDARRREGLPGEKKGKEWEFDTEKVIAWLIRRETKGSKTDKKAEMDLRTATIEAETKEYKLEELRKNMTTLDTYVEIFEEQCAVIKSKITALPGRVAQKCAVMTDASEILVYLKGEVAEVLEEIASEDPKDKPLKTIDPPRKHGFRFDGEEDEDEGPVLTEDGY